jgi:cation transport ATPase
MSCAACSAKVERTVRALDGVKSCSVNLLTGDMTVEGDVDSDVVINAVIQAGYSACEKSCVGEKTKKAKEEPNLELRTTKIKLIISKTAGLTFGLTKWDI